MKICHVTTAHPAKDIRIFHKECASLASAGYDVTLLVAGTGDDEVDKGVKIVRVPVKFRSRPGRILKAPFALASRVRMLKPDVVHFHDPEFLLAAGKLKRKGYKVIYDIHEDLPRQILSKFWIPVWFRRQLSVWVEKFENRRAARLDYLITATPFIADRFKAVNHRTTDVKNYPLAEEFLATSGNKPMPYHLCYVGGLTAIRGIRELVTAVEGCDVILDLAGPVESCDFFHAMKELPGWKKKIYHGIVDRKVVAKIMSEALAGMVLFHPVPNHTDAMPTKLFEYMIAGIPVIASDFPSWRKLLEGHDCGICVDPMDAGQVRDAIRSLTENPARAAEMGANGRKAALAQYVWEIEKQKLLEVYRQVSGA